MNQRALHYYEFGPFRLNATERLLQRGSEAVPLTPKVFDTLLVLVENSGHVLEKNELMQQLWPDSFVEESSLTQNISLLRRALSDPNNEDNYIETIPKRGYRFVAPVQERNEISNGNGNGYEIVPLDIDEPDNTIHISSVPAASQPGSFTRKYAVALSAVVAMGLLLASIYWYRNRLRGANFAPRSVAVLPFKTIGTNSENDLLGLGMADAMIIKLSRLDQMTVLPTSSIYRFTNRDRDPVAIGKELGVEGVLDGTVQRDGDWVRVTAQLIRLSDGKTVWSGKFDERYNSIFTLQDSISDQLSSSLRPQVAGETKKVHPTNNTEAYRNYITGLYFWNRRTKDNLSKAINYLEQAVAQDPNFAEAHAILADCNYLRLTDEYAAGSPDESLNKARTSTAKALELDDSLAEAHTVNAGLNLFDRQFDEAGREFQRALELNPNYAVAHVRYAYFLYSSRLLDQALFHMQRAQQLDPVSSVTNGALAGMLYSARQYDESISYSQKALELEPTTLAPHLNLGEAYLQKRMFNEAQAAFEKVRYTSPVYYYWEMAYSYALSGKREEANRMLAEYEKQNSDGLRMHYNYALVYGAMGEKDKAFAELDLMSAGPFMLAGVKYDPQFDPLRGDPRFQAYMKKHGLE